MSSHEAVRRRPARDAHARRTRWCRARPAPAAASRSLRRCAAARVGRADPHSRERWRTAGSRLAARPGAPSPAARHLRPAWCAASHRPSSSTCGTASRRVRARAGRSARSAHYPTAVHWATACRILPPAKTRGDQPTAALQGAGTDPGNQENSTRESFQYDDPRGSKQPAKMCPGVSPGEGLG